MKSSRLNLNQSPVSKSVEIPFWLNAKQTEKNYLTKLWCKTLGEIKISDYRELYLISWSFDRDHLAIDDEMAFGLYQSGWRLVSVDRMDEREWSLLLRLVNIFGPIRHEFMGKAVEVVTLEDLKACRASGASGGAYSALTSDSINALVFDSKEFPFKTRFSGFRGFYDFP